MDQAGNYIENLAVGIKVEINPQRDKSRKKRVEGVISKILTRSPEHTHGILVELKNGETGRVKKIIKSSTPTNRHKKEIIGKQTPKQDLFSLITNGENHFVAMGTSISLKVSAKLNMH
jgi:uncharacterized repeat protein (TIGR03833 family)